MGVTFRGAAAGRVTPRTIAEDASGVVPRVGAIPLLEPSPCLFRTLRTA